MFMDAIVLQYYIYIDIRHVTFLFIRFLNSWEAFKSITCTYIIINTFKYYLS